MIDFEVLLRVVPEEDVVDHKEEGEAGRVDRIFLDQRISELSHSMDVMCGPAV